MPKATRRFGAIIGALIVVGILVLLVSKLSPQTTLRNDKAIVLPNFSNIVDSIQDGENEWIITGAGVIRRQGEDITFYTQREGLPGYASSDIINYEGDIWIGQSGGIAKFLPQKNTFATSLVDVHNVNFELDPYTNTLYARTFSALYRFNKQWNTWSKETIGTDQTEVASIAFTPDKIFITFTANAESTVNGAIFERATKKWSAFAINELSPSSHNYFLQADSHVAVFGRSSSYLDCEDQGKNAATLFFEYTATGWQPVPELNERFFLYEPWSVRKKRKTNTDALIYGSDDCSGRSTKHVSIPVSFKNNRWNLGPAKELPNANRAFKDQEIERLVNIGKDISQKVGRTAYQELLGIDDDANLLVATTPEILRGWSVQSLGLSFDILDAQLKQRAIVSSKENNPYVEYKPILCNSSSQKRKLYLIAGTAEGPGAPLPDLYEITTDWRSKEIQLSEKTQERLYAINKNATCVDGKIYWEESDDNKSTIYTLQPSTEKLSTVQSIPQPQSTSEWKFSDVNDRLMLTPPPSHQQKHIIEINKDNLPFWGNTSPFSEKLDIIDFRVFEDFHHQLFWFSNPNTGLFAIPKELIY